MTNTIVIEPADRPTLPRERRGIILGIMALVLSLITAFWALFAWIIWVSVGRTDATVVAAVIFAIVAIIGIAMFGVTLVFGILAVIRNQLVGVICGSVALVIALGALGLGLTLATSLPF